MVKKVTDIDVGLTALVINKRPGQILTTRAIAEVCGVTSNAIYEIEQNALRKLQRNRVLRDNLY